jgi:hypothetical protein
VPAWSRTDRTLHDVLAEFGPASVTFGDPDPHRPKTLSYVRRDRNAPVVAFHFGPPRAEADPRSERTGPTGAALLAVRVNEGLFAGWELTPHGEAVFTAAP